MTPLPVEVSGVSRMFRRRMVIQSLDLQVAAGSCAVVTGANGAGKSTLIRMLAGTVRPSAGVVRIFGQDPARAGRGRSPVGVSFSDDRSWYWRLSGRDNLRYFAALAAAPSADLDARLAAVGLADAAGVRVGEYSTGMRARLGLARAMLGNPSLLLLDEPTRALDADGAAMTRALVHAKVRGGAAAILTTHDPADVAELATTHLHLDAAPGAGVGVATRVATRA